MLVLLIVLAVTNLAAFGALGVLVLRPPDWLGTRWPRSDPVAAQALDRAPRPPVAAGTTRRLITVEILNPQQLAGARGRIASIASVVVPGLTRRVVYGHVFTILKQGLAEQDVVADVRIHVLRPSTPTTDSKSESASDPDSAPDSVSDEVTVVDLDESAEPE